MSSSLLTPRFQKTPGNIYVFTSYSLISPKGFFKTYVYKTRQVGGPKMSPFVNVCTIENVNTRG